MILGTAEVVSALRADPLTRDSKVLLVVDESTARDPRAAGADERLAMPFSPLQLQVKLRKLLGADAVGAMIGRARARAGDRRGVRQPWVTPQLLDPSRVAMRASRSRARTRPRTSPQPSVELRGLSPSNRTAREAGVSAPDFAVVGGGIVGCSLRRVPRRGGRASRRLRARGDRRGRLGAQLRRRPAPARPRARRALRGVRRALRDARSRLRAARRPGRAPARHRRPGQPRARAVGVPGAAPDPARGRRPARRRADARRGPRRLAPGDRAARPAAAAANAFATRAREAGAEFRIGEPAYVALDGDPRDWRHRRRRAPAGRRGRGLRRPAPGRPTHRLRTRL